jgi:hypothetical protein
MKLNKDLREFIVLLNSTGVRYLLPIYFLSRDHLLANKRASGLPQDLADLDKLESTP